MSCGSRNTLDHSGYMAYAPVDKIIQRMNGAWGQLGKASEIIGFFLLCELIPVTQ